MKYHLSVYCFLKKIMASGPMTSWEIDGETVETVSDFTFLGSKITADGDCSHEIKRRLLLGRKVRANLDSIFKSRDITLPTKVHIVKAMVFPVAMYGLRWWLTVGDPGSIPGLGRSPGDGNSNPLQCSCLENPRDGGAW